MVIQASPFGPVRTEADAIVADRQGQLRRQDVEPDGHGMGLGMTGNVGQPLLDHAIAKQGHWPGHARYVAVMMEDHGQPRLCLAIRVQVLFNGYDQAQVIQPVSNFEFSRSFTARRLLMTLKAFARRPTSSFVSTGTRTL